MVGYLFSNSCIMPYYFPIYSRKRVIDLSDVKPGITTKEEVLLKFGSAFTSDQKEKLFTAVYDLTKGHYGWALILPNMIIDPKLGKDKSINTWYEVEIEFDDNDVVKRCEVYKLPRDKLQEKIETENK